MKVRTRVKDGIKHLAVMAEARTKRMIHANECVCFCVYQRLNGNAASMSHEAKIWHCNISINLKEAILC